MKKNYKLIFVFLVLLCCLTGCNSSSNNPKKDKEKQFTVEESKLKEISDLESVRENVISKFKDSRNVLGTGKYIEDSYNKYSSDEIISNIYFYYSAMECLDFSSATNDSWYQKAKNYASKVSPDYNGPFSEEMIEWVKNFLGEEWQKEYELALQKEENYKKLTLEDKKDILEYIDQRWQYYANKENLAIDSYKLDEMYGDTIWKEAADKYNISINHVSALIMDIDLTKEIGKDYESKKIITEFDAILNYDNGSSIIAVSEDALDRYIQALVDKNEGTIAEMRNSFKISFVPKGIKVNIIEKKATVAKVKILDGIFAGNEAWILIESVDEK